MLPRCWSVCFFLSCVLTSLPRIFYDIINNTYFLYCDCLCCQQQNIFLPLSMLPAAKHISPIVYVTSSNTHRLTRLAASHVLCFQTYALPRLRLWRQATAKTINPCQDKLGLTDHASRQVGVTADLPDGNSMSTSTAGNWSTHNCALRREEASL